ncbi:MAG TPA: hypothetical protein DCP28_15440, partial [Cytophagales bacterium]|nr:hypothetical protein [Cytophagales bacterium]
LPAGSQYDPVANRVPFADGTVVTGDQLQVQFDGQGNPTHFLHPSLGQWLNLATGQYQLTASAGGTGSKVAVGIGLA